MRLSVGVRAMAATLAAACMAVSLTGDARAQEDPTTTTTIASTTTTTDPTSTSTSSTTTTTTQPATPTTSPSTSTTAPGQDEGPTTPTTAGATSTTTRPGTSPTTAPPARPAPVGNPPAVGGDAAPPPGATPEISAALQAKIDSVRRSGPNNTTALIEALSPLVAMGMTAQEAIQAGFGRFPVGGRASFTDDWWFPRFVPSVHLHEGTDIFAAYGTPARAPATGTLNQRFNPVGGLTVYVTEADGTYYYLAHLSRYEPGQVSGQAVQAGDVIGYVGDSGNARGTSPHIHFEVHPGGGGPTNPKPFLDAWLEEAIAAVPSLVAATAPAPAGAGRTPTEEQDLTVVGHTDLGGRGGYGDVVVVGDTALVAAGDGAPRPVAAIDPLVAGTAATPSCSASVAVVDLRDPASPIVAGTIALASGERVEDVDALAVRTPGFTGDLAAVAVGPCTPGDGGTGLVFYDVSDPSDPQLLGRVPHPRRLADGGGTGCGAVLRGTCARTDRTVDLQQRPDGRVVSLSSATAAADEPDPEAFVVDLTAPARPRALGFVPLGRGDRPLAVDDGCSPVRLPRSQQTPADRLGPLVDITGFALAPEGARAPDEIVLDAAAGYPTVAEGGGRRLALATEGAWWSSTWALRVDAPAEAGGEKPGCARALSSSSDGAGPTAGELVYVGRGCPGRHDADGTPIPPDPYLGDPAGRIAVTDAALTPSQQHLSGHGCTPASRLARARRAGALGLVVAGSFQADVADVATIPAAPAGVPAGDGSAARASGAIPAVLLRKPDGDALRTALCPPALDPDAACGESAGISAEVVELPARWSGLRVLDVTDPDAPRQIAVYRTAAAATTPSDPGASFAVEAVVTDGSRVYAAWGADGLRVLDLASGSPSEVGSFVPPVPPVPPAGPGATPAVPHVAGVDQTADHIVVADRDSGLWVLDKRPPAGTRGYWLADAKGAVHAFGDAVLHGAADDLALTSPVAGMAASPTAGGYWLVTAAGGVYTFGDATFAGSLSGAATAPIVGIAATPSGRGYWLVAADGGVFAFGDATFLGSLGASALVRPIVALVPTPTGRGYRLVGADGGVFAFGDADFLGSTAATPPVAPVVGAAGTSSGRGYWLVAADGSVFVFGDARFKGAAAGRPATSPVAGVAAMTGVRGYWLAGADGRVDALGTPDLGGSDTAGASAPAVVAVAAVPRPPAAAGPTPAANGRETGPGLRPAR